LSRHHIIIFACISSSHVLGPLPPFPVAAAPDALASNISISLMVGDVRMIPYVAEPQLLHDSQGVDAKKENSNNWDKLPDMVQNMILKLSAAQDNNLPTETCKSYSKILKQSKVLGMAMMINLELSLKKCKLRYPQQWQMNKSELGGIPKDIPKKLAGNKFYYPETTHLLRYQLVERIIMAIGALRRSMTYHCPCITIRQICSLC
jgi:hypothetical protein